jgi:mercuric ion transport protein
LTYFMGALAFLTCPCHLPILLLLLSGTAAGAYLSQNLGIAFLLLLPVFLLSAFTTWRLLDKREEKRPQNTFRRHGRDGRAARAVPSR